MIRERLLDDCPEGSEAYANSLIDHMESIFQDIRDRLDIKGLGDLDQVEVSYDIAKKACDDLY